MQGAKKRWKQDLGQFGFCALTHQLSEASDAFCCRPTTFKVWSNVGDIYIYMETAIMGLYGLYKVEGLGFRGSGDYGSFSRSQSQETPHSLLVNAFRIAQK